MSSACYAVLGKELPSKLIGLQACLVGLGPAFGVGVGNIMSAAYKDTIASSRFGVAFPEPVSPFFYSSICFRRSYCL
jgi:hypothetical protein